MQVELSNQTGKVVERSFHGGAGLPFCRHEKMVVCAGSNGDLIVRCAEYDNGCIVEFRSQKHLPDVKLSTPS